MRMVSLAAIAGAVVALLAAFPLLDRENPASALLVDIICYGTSLIGPAAATEHSEHPAGLYMPMFSTPPAGGLIYNGPALDQC
jgi:hypothetical protein